MFRNSMPYEVPPSTDEETGEKVLSSATNIEMINFDMETGEPSSSQYRVTMHKTKFNIPKSCLAQPATAANISCLDNTTETYSLIEKKDIMHLQEEIILGSNKFSHRLFLVPTLFTFIFTRFLLLFLILVEVMLHIWAHRKNAANSNANVYYRSPLHVMTSPFCAACRQDESMDYVSRIQDERTRQHFKQFTRSIT